MPWHVAPLIGRNLLRPLLFRIDIHAASQYQLRMKVSCPLTLTLSHEGAREKINKRMK
jgi:hypothetical protein